MRVNGYLDERYEPPAPVPKHKEVKRGLLMEIVAEAGLTREEFLKLPEEI